jgi:hypothetical protein
MNAVPKLNLIRDRKYLDSHWEARCIISGELTDENETVEGAHLGSRRNHGDDETLPVKHRYHKYEHDHGTVSMWRKFIPDWLLLAALRAYARELYQAYRREHP